MSAKSSSSSASARAQAEVKAWLSRPDPVSRQQQVGADSSVAGASSTGSSSGDIVLRFIFKWKLLLDTRNERRPFAHFYLSTTYSTTVHKIELEQPTGQMPLSLTFQRAAPSATDNNSAAENLLADCDLNVHFFTRTENAYQEAVQNPAGALILPLHALFYALILGDGLVDKSVDLHMVHKAHRKSKGEVQFRVVALKSGRTSPISLGELSISSKHYNKLRTQRKIDRVMRMQNINARFIEATEVLYERVRPTTDAVARINSAIWVSSAGVFPPIAYLVDVVKPILPASFFENCLQVILKRNRLPRLPAEWKLTGTDTNVDHVLAMENLCGHLLCLLEVHCIYRSDFVYAYDTNTNEFIKVATEDFGDISVDRGAGDCEDFGKMIIRLFRALQRLSGTSGVSEDLQRVIDFLACYYPFLVLLGVSSAQINAAAKDIVDMGAHENCILLPRLRFLRMAAQTCPAIDAWMLKMLRDDPDCREVRNWRQSLQYSSIVCEGTGMLHPTEKPEETIHIRKLMENFMNENTFFALRREYFFSEKEGGFYKTVEKIFLGWSILDQKTPAMPSFLVMQQHSDSARDLKSMPVNKLLTKSVAFNAFLRACSMSDSKAARPRGGNSENYETVRLLMEPLLKPAEWTSIYDGMKNIHPPMPMFPPNYSAPQPFRLRCDELMEAMFHGTKHDYTGSPGRVVTMTYYLRASKVDKNTCGDVHDLLIQLKDDGLVEGWSIFPEWVTDEIGGYRIEVAVNPNRAVALQARIQKKEKEEEQKKKTETTVDDGDGNIPHNVARIRL